MSDVKVTTLRLKLALHIRQLGATLEMVGRRLGVSSERARQLVHKAKQESITMPSALTEQELLELFDHESVYNADDVFELLLAHFDTKMQTEGTWRDCADFLAEVYEAMMADEVHPDSNFKLMLDAAFSSHASALGKADWEGIKVHTGGADESQTQESG